MNKVGAYLPSAYEEVVDVVDAYVLTEKVSVFICVQEKERQTEKEERIKRGIEREREICKLLFLPS